MVSFRLGVHTYDVDLVLVPLHHGRQRSSDLVKTTKKKISLSEIHTLNLAKLWPI